MNDRELVRNYVTGADHLQYSWLAEGSVQLNVTHSNLKQYVMELRLDLHTPIREVKRKLYTHNGTSLDHMELHLRNNGATVAVMLDDERPLGYYGAQNGMEIHVMDRDPFSLSRDGGLDDVSKIEKYRMSDEDYDKREKTLRAYKRQMLEKDPNFRFVNANRPKPNGSETDYTDEACVASIAVGARCSITPGDRRGTVMFVGKVDALAPGFWVGVRLDEPLGKNDGTTAKDGKRYFDAPAGYGSFVRPDRMAVGDFPPEMDEFEPGCGCGEHCDDHAPAEPAVVAQQGTAAAVASTSAAPPARVVRASARAGGDSSDDEL